MVATAVSHHELGLRFHLILPLARRHVQQEPQCANFLGLLTHRYRQFRRSLCAKRRIQSVDQSLFANRLVQEANRSRLHRLLSCLCVPVIRDEDDGYWMRRSQVPLQLEAVHPRHRDVEDHAGHILEIEGSPGNRGRRRRSRYGTRSTSANYRALRGKTDRHRRSRLEPGYFFLVGVFIAGNHLPKENIFPPADRKLVIHWYSWFWWVGQSSPLGISSLSVILTSSARELCTHFLHNPAAMNFDGDLADS